MKAAGKGLGRIVGILIFVFPVILILLVPPATRAQSECTDCQRTAYLNNVTTNTAEPNFRTMVKYRMWETLTSGCFHFLAEGNYIPQNYLSYCETEKRPPEYYFDVNYVENLPGPVLSRLSIDMYFVGPPQEKVINWATEGDRPDQHFIQYHENKMFKMDFGISDPRTSVLLRYRPIEEKVLKDFEKRPTQCLVKPAKKTVNPLEEIEVVISGIEDAKGERSREFNRLVVQAVEGKIVGGESLLVDRDLKAFKVGHSDVTFTYRAPSSPKTGEDTIYVYNACDILPEATVPMANTKMKDKIAEEKIEIREYDALLQVTRRDMERKLFELENPNGTSYHKEVWENTADVTVTATLEQDTVIPMPMLNEIVENYRIRSFSLESFQNLARHDDEEWSKDKNGIIDWNLTRNIKEIGHDARFSDYYMNLPKKLVVVFVDAKTKKAKKVIIGGFPLEFQKTVNEDLMVRGKEPRNEHKTRFEKGEFDLKPVADQVLNPTLDANALGDYFKELSKTTGTQIPLPPQMQGPKPELIFPESIVKSGDRETTLGGDGRYFKEQREKDTYTRTERIYTWQMTRKKKKN